MKKEKEESESEDLDAPQPLTAEEQEYLKKVEAGNLEEATAIEEEKHKTKAPEEKYSYYYAMHYGIDRDLGLVYKDYDLISKQRKLVFNLIKQIGGNILRGKSIMNISLPVYVFEPTSLLQRVTSFYAYAPELLLPIPSIQDPVEKFRRVMAWAVASMHLGIEQRKPFNPILGETFQAKIGDMDAYVEQTVHHPPISNILILGKDVQIHAKFQVSVHTYPNSAKAKVSGARHIEVAGAYPAHYVVSNPLAEITGIMFGKRVFNYMGDIRFKDKTNKLYGLIRVNPIKQGFISSIFLKKVHRDDHILGFITKNKELFGDTSENVFVSPDIIRAEPPPTSIP